jgi:serine/threonine protein kinase
MAEIYLAEDLSTGARVAIKMVPRGNEDYCERFQREILANAALIHEHILPAFDYGVYEDWYYMAMPYIEGGTLMNRIVRGPCTLEEVGTILMQLTDALQFAHDQGIVHRDIKPANIFMRDDHYVYLADFGLVKDVNADHSITQSGIIIGTPDYMAPELVDAPATPASDIYALGVLLYQMLTGTLPFKAASPIATILKHLQEQPAAPSIYNSALPAEVEYVILKALEKKPQKRFQSAQELNQAYQNALIKQNEVITPAAQMPTITLDAAATLSLVARARNSIELRFRALSRPLIIAFVAMLLFAASLLGGELFQGHPLPDTSGTMDVSAAVPISTPAHTTSRPAPKPAHSSHKSHRRVTKTTPKASPPVYYVSNGHSHNKVDHDHSLHKIARRKLERHQGSKHKGRNYSIGRNHTQDHS